MITMLVWSGLASAVRAEDGIAAPRYTRRVLSEMSQDVLRRGSIGPTQSVPDSVTPGPDSQHGMAVVGSAPEPAPLITHIGPSREGISVPIPATPSASTKLVPSSGAISYQSNSWRQARPEAARALSFSSGVLAPSAGLDPALKAQADQLRSQGSQ